MGWNQFSSPQKPADLYEPIPLEAILQGNKAVYDRGEKNYTKIQGLIDNVYNLPSLQGKDTEVKNKIIQSYMDNVSQLAKGNLTDPKTAAQIESYISRVTRDPQIANIVQRATTVAQEQKTKQEYELKGKKYISPILDEAEGYLNEGVFLADKKFNNFGFVAPDIAEFATKANSLTPQEERTIYNPKTGEYTVIKEKNPQKLEENFRLLASQDPNTDKLLRYQFNQKYKDLDWDTEGQVKLANDVNNLRSQIYYAEAQGIDATPYKQSLQQYETLLQNPSLIGKPLQEEMFNMEKENYFNTALQGAAYANTGIPELSDLSKMNRQFAQAKALKKIDKQNQIEVAKFKEEEKNKYKQAAAKATDPLKRQMIMQAVNLGYTIELEDPSQPDGLLSVPELVKLGIAKPEKEKKAEIVREDVNSFRNIFEQNKDKVKKIISEKLGGGLGVGGFSASDIEDVKWNKDTNRYEIEIDDSWYGSNETISLTQEEVDNLSKVVFKKGEEILEIPLSDVEAINEAESSGYTKE